MITLRKRFIDDLRHVQGAKEIVARLYSMGYAINIRDAHSVWADHSQDCFKGVFMPTDDNAYPDPWMKIPEDDDALLAAIKMHCRIDENSQIAPQGPTEQVTDDVWKPIETAPKNGTVVDLWVRPFDGRAHRRTNVWWLNSEKWSGWREGKFHIGKDGQPNGKFVHSNHTPTHWMLPPGCPN